MACSPLSVSQCLYTSYLISLRPTASRLHFPPSVRQWELMEPVGAGRGITPIKGTQKLLKNTAHILSPHSPTLLALL